MLTHLNGTPSPPRRVVVIGGGGFVGGAITDRLAAASVPTVEIGRKTVDLLGPDADIKLRSLLEPEDAVVAVSAIVPCRNARMLADNMALVLTLTNALHDAPISHLVNISSDAVYADGPLPLTEASSKAPTSLHGAMHLARELALTTELSVPTAMLRPTLIYGPDDPHNGYGPNRFRRQVEAGRDIELFGEGEERRDHVSVDDVAEIVSRVLFHRSVGALNVATGTVVSFREIAEMVVRISDKTVAIKGTPRSGPMPHGGYRPFDTGAAEKAFPDFAWTPLEEGLKRAAGKAP